MTTELEKRRKDRLAIELAAVKTQISRLEKIKKQLNARIIAIAPEEWLNNQQHMVEDVIAGDRYCSEASVETEQRKSCSAPLPKTHYPTAWRGKVCRA